MSNIVWSAEKGWHDGPPVKITLENGKVATKKMLDPTARNGPPGPIHAGGSWSDPQKKPIVPGTDPTRPVTTDGRRYADTGELTEYGVAQGKTRSRRCEALARKGTGTGVCDRPLDEHENCDRASNHVEEK